MANMTFKASLIPNSNLGYNLGSSDKRWNIYGDLTGTASWANGLAIHNANECTICSTSSATNPSIYINYRSQLGGTTSDGATQVTSYYFGNRKGGTTGVTLYAASFSGNAASATTASTLTPSYVTNANPNTMYTTGLYTIGSLASGASLPVSCWVEMAVLNYHTNGGNARVL